MGEGSSYRALFAHVHDAIRRQLEAGVHANSDTIKSGREVPVAMPRMTRMRVFRMRMSGMPFHDAAQLARLSAHHPLTATVKASTREGTTAVEATTSVEATTAPPAAKSAAGRRITAKSN